MNVDSSKHVDRVKFSNLHLKCQEQNYLRIDNVLVKSFLIFHEFFMTFVMKN